MKKRRKKKKKKNSSEPNRNNCNHSSWFVPFLFRSSSNRTKCLSRFHLRRSTNEISLVRLSVPLVRCELKMTEIRRCFSSLSFLRLPFLELSEKVVVKMNDSDEKEIKEWFRSQLTKMPLADYCSGHIRSILKHPTRLIDKRPATNGFIADKTRISKENKMFFVQTNLWTRKYFPHDSQSIIAKLIVGLK